MTPIDLSQYAAEGIALAYHEAPGLPPTLELTGTLEHPNPSIFMDPLLADLDARLRARGAGRLRIDLSGLEFMNSSGIKSLIRYVMRLGEAPAAERYALEFVYAPHITWQHGSLRAVTMLARGGASLVTRAAA